MVLGRQLPGEAPDGGEVRGAAGEELEDRREATTGAGNGDAGAGCVLREAQHGGAVVEQRPEAEPRVEGRPVVEHGQMGDELNGGFPLAGGERVQPGEQVGIRERGGGSLDVHRHAPVYHGGFSRRRRRVVARRDDERHSIVSARPPLAQSRRDEPLGVAGMPCRGCAGREASRRGKSRVRNKWPREINFFESTAQRLHVESPSPPFGESVRPETDRPSRTRTVHVHRDGSVVCLQGGQSAPGRTRPRARREPSHRRRARTCRRRDVSHAKRRRRPGIASGPPILVGGPAAEEQCSRTNLTSRDGSAPSPSSSSSATPSASPPSPTSSPPARRIT